MSSDARILVIGDGPVGSTAVATLCRLGCAHIFLSKYSKGDLINKQLFGQDIPTSYEREGGLGRLWHSVCDMGLLNRKGFVASHISKKFIGDIEFRENTEFVPFFQIKPARILKDLTYGELPPVDSLTLSEGVVEVKFTNDKVEIFDKVLVCHGAMPNIDCLVNSGLATLSASVSDHLVAQVEGLKSPLFAGKKRERVIFSGKGIFRSYIRNDVGEFKYKISARPNYRAAKRRVLHLDKGIYVGSKVQVLKRLMLRGSLDAIKQSLFLRYGLFSRSKNWTCFINVAVKNCYIRKNGTLIVDDARIADLKKSLEKDGLRLLETSLMSGIHFHNTYDYLSSNVSNNIISNKRIILVAPSYNFDVGAEHFTFQMMLMAESIARSLADE